MANRRTHSVDVDVHNKGNACWVVMHADKAVPERKFIAAVGRVASKLHATIVKLEESERVAELRIKAHKKVNRVLNCVQREVRCAFSAKHRRHIEVDHSCRERPMRRAPALVYSS
jgi:hypothetical protein